MSAVAEFVERIRPRVSKRTVGPIGVDFSLESLHMVQLEQSAGAAPMVRASTSVPFECPRAEVFEDEHRFRSIIRRALDADRFQGRRCVIAVPSGRFRTLSVNYRSSGGDANEAAAVLGVVKDRLDGDLSKYVLDFLPVSNRSKNDERLALVAVSEKERIVEFLELARAARLDVQALEIGPVAICRLVAAISENDENRNVLVINTGRRASYLTLIAGDDVLFDQEVEFGERALVTQVSEALEMSDEMAHKLMVRAGVGVGIDARESAATIDEDDLLATIIEILKPQFLTLVDEIKRVCLYAAAETRGGAVSRIFVLGSIARWPGTESLLSQMIGIDVAKIPDPLRPFGSPADGVDQAGKRSAPELAVATGLALRGLVDA